MTPGAARLFLTIPSPGKPETFYRVEFLDPTPAVRVAWRLTKEDGTVYDVTLTEHGLACCCQDFLWRKRGETGEGCKHCMALRSLGLFGRRNLPGES